MHTVRCPACRRVLQIDEDVARAKLRCRNCGKVFVASVAGAATASSAAGSPPVSSSAAAAADGGPRPHLYHTPKPQRAPKWAVVPLFVVAPLLILVIVLIAVFYGERPGAGSEKPSTGPPERPVVQRPPRTSQPPGPGTYAQTPISSDSADDLPADGDQAQVPQGRPAPVATRPAAEKLHPGKNIEDPGVQIVGLTSHQVDSWWTIVHGTAELRNRHDADGVIREVTVVVDAYEGPRLVGSRETTLRYIPAGRGLPFSAEFRDLRAENVELKARIVALDWAPSGTVCLWVEPEQSVRDDDPRTCTLDVAVPNRTGSALKNIRLYCHFANPRGVVQESSTNYVPLEAGLVAPDETIAFDAARFQVPLAPVLAAYPRIVAERAPAR